jgi:diguanylate cyclase (GGDEF)-like protein/PAS domain S-box-containing protein
MTSRPPRCPSHPERAWTGRAGEPADDDANPGRHPREGLPHAAVDEELRARVADVVHELRAPTAIALGLVERLARDGALLPDARRDVERLAVNLRVLETHVRTLSTGVRMDGGVPAGSTAVLDVALAFRRTAEDFASVAAERGVRLAVEAPLRLAAPVEPGHLLVILSNLLVNAIRHTPADGTVRCSLAFDGVLRIAVADSGPGIPEDERPRMLARFGRARRAKEGDLALGLGLGLEIVGRIARLYDGWVRLGDAPEGGALVTVGLPLGPLPQPGAVPAAAGTAVVRTLEAPAGARGVDRPLGVAVADDPARGAALAEALAADGTREAVAVDPDEVVTAGLAFDVAVLELHDHATPQVLLRDLRSDPGHDEVPVVALVDPRDVGLRLELLRLGVDDLAEPGIAPEELCGRVDRQVARRRREEQRRTGAARFRGAFRDAAIGIGLATVGGAWEAVNPALCAITGLSEGALLRGRLDDLDHPEDRGSEAAPLRELLRGETRGFQLDKRWVTPSGEVVWVRLSVSAERDGVGAPSGLVVQVEDVTDARAREGRLEHLAGHDRLTGLLARAAFEVEVRRLVVQAREGGTHGAVVALAVEELGEINRSHGHHAGDHALHLVARVLEDAVRRTDVVARTGGDGFAILLEEIAPDDLGALVAQLDALVRDHPLVVDGTVVPVSAVFGWARLDGTRTAADVLRQAEDDVRAQQRAAREEPAPSAPRRRPRTPGGASA